MRHTSKIDVSVIILTYNSARTIERCIKSLLAQKLSNIKYEIIILDGGSTDDTLTLIERYLTSSKYEIVTRIIPNSTIGKRRNIGVTMARGNFVAFIDSDCIADPCWLKTLFEKISSIKDEKIVGVGGPNLIPPDATKISRVIMSIQKTFLGSGGSPGFYEIKEERSVYTIANCNAIYKKHALLAEKYDDELNIGEDADINFRLVKKGYKLLYVPKAVVWHYQYFSTKDFLKKMFKYGAAAAKLTKKHKTLLRWYSILAPIAVISLFLMILLSYSFQFLKIILFTSFLGLFSISLITSMQVFRKTRSLYSSLVIILLPLQYICYGLGFLKGLIFD